MARTKQGRPRGRGALGWSLVYLEVRRMQSRLGWRVSPVSELDGLSVPRLEELRRELVIEMERAKVGAGLFGRVEASR